MPPARPTGADHPLGWDSARRQSETAAVRQRLRLSVWHADQVVTGSRLPEA